ncbi:sigma 54-interacting transcriptional regulator, partial [Reinekea sp.]|uniref:sigma 54-interacting transcriptional regulator n=1 Tax=Reinekea sp. TaxID=1970455 RepID=UPI002580208E
MSANHQLRLIGESSALSDVLDQVSRVAPLNRPILVIGERGTGKELIAERLHFLSLRWQQPLLKVNCGAISESLLDADLFGYEPGAFTGANRVHKGRFERADEGTLLLDELGNMSAAVQEKVLRVIEYGEFERLGGQKT